MAIIEATAFATIRELGAGLRNGEFTSVELTQFFLDRLERLGPRFNAVVRVTQQTALDQAAKADRELAAGRDRGPLHGIPFGVKDLLATKGIPTSWGAAPLKDQMIDVDATVIVRLREAGAVLAAKLAMVELAGGFGYRQANAAFTGPGLNPWNEKHWSGGSSSGPGSAVGAGLVPFAIGSETWGSIMSPSGNCGITGLRPTYGRVSRHGAMALSWTMDKLGPMCRSAEDCGIVLDAVAGPDEHDPSAVDREFEFPSREPFAAPFKFATLKGATDHVQPAIARNYRLSLEVLADLGTFEEIELPDLPYGTVAATMISCEMAAAFDAFINSGDVWELTAEEDRFGGFANQAIPAKDYINAMRIRATIQRVLDELLSRYDAIVTPALATIAKPIDKPFRESSPGFYGTAIGGAGNAAGVPAICVPNGFGEQGLPTSLQFVARAFDEAKLLAIAQAYQERTAWHRKHPVLG